jgi:hypothetical protein
MSTTLTGVTTCRDMSLYIAGRKLGSISEASITGNSALKDVSSLGFDYKKNIRSFKEFSGSWSMWIEDLEALGLILGEYWVDPTKLETWPTINYDGSQYLVTHVQGSHAGTVTVTTGNEVAQKFRAGGSTLTSTGVKLYNAGSGDSSVTVTVEADSSGEPSGTPLDTDTVDFSGGAGWVTADLSSATLTKGNWYWIVCAVPTTSTGFGRSSTDIYEDWGYMENTGTWGSLEDNDLSFYIETTDNSVSMVIELTDSVNTHIINADIGPGTGSFAVNLDEPISAEVNYTAKTVTYSG